MPTKPWWQSKTVAFNLLFALAAAAETGFPTLRPALGDAAYAIGLFALTLGNVVLRFVTTQGIGKE